MASNQNLIVTAAQHPSLRILNSRVSMLGESTRQIFHQQLKLQSWRKVWLQVENANVRRKRKQIFRTSNKLCPSDLLSFHQTKCSKFGRKVTVMTALVQETNKQLKKPVLTKINLLQRTSENIMYKIA